MKLSNISNSTIMDEECLAAYCYCWMNLFKSIQCVQESMMINKNSFVLLEHLAMLLTSTIAINC